MDADERDEATEDPNRGAWKFWLGAPVVLVGVLVLAAVIGGVLLTSKGPSGEDEAIAACKKAAALYSTEPDVEITDVDAQHTVGDDYIVTGTVHPAGIDPIDFECSAVKRSDGYLTKMLKP